MLARNSESDRAEEFLQEQLHTCAKKYEASKEYFKEHCHNMMDFLREYNLIDTRLLAESIVRYADGFLEQWGVDIHEFMSVSWISICFYLLKY